MSETMGRCATCKHFEGLPADERENPLTPSKDGYGLARFFDGCCRIAEADDFGPKDGQKMACSMDGSEYRASLLVKKEFGCTEYVAGDGSGGRHPCLT